MVWTAEEKERLHEELNRLEAEHLATAASIMPRNDSSQIASPASMVPRENTLQPYPSETHTSLTNQYVKQQKWLQRKQSHTLELRRDKESEELKQCTFQPNINRSRSHAHPHRSSTGDVVERLFDAHEEAAARLKQICQADEQRKMKECTFRPAIVEDAWTDFVAPRYFDPMVGPSPAQIGGDCTFTPRINKNISRAAQRSGSATQRYLGEGVFHRLGQRRDNHPNTPTPGVSGMTPPRSTKVLDAEQTKKFAERMQAFIVRHEKKVQRQKNEENSQNTFTPRLAKKTSEIAKKAAPFSARRDKYHVSDRSRTHATPHDAIEAAACTFTPQINNFQPSSGVPRSHTPDELCYHWNERRQKRIDAARGERLRLELEGSTFTPRTSSPPAHCNVSSRKSMISNPALYMQRVTAERVRQERIQSEHRRFMQSAEMQECTFQPMVHDAPQYIHSIAASMAIARKQREHETKHRRHTFGYT